MKHIEGNTNFIDKDGLIHNIYVGDQTVSKLKKSTEELLGLTTSLREHNKPILVLTDITKLGKIGLQARGYAVEMVKTIEFDKVAIFGNPKAIERVVNFIILASGRGYKMQYFSSKTDAKKWLLS